MGTMNTGTSATNRTGIVPTSGGYVFFFALASFLLVTAWEAAAQGGPGNLDKLIASETADAQCQPIQGLDAPRIRHRADGYIQHISATPGTYFPHLPMDGAKDPASIAIDFIKT